MWRKVPVGTFATWFAFLLLLAEEVHEGLEGGPYGVLVQRALDGGFGDVSLSLLLLRANVSDGPPIGLGSIVGGGRTLKGASRGQLEEEGRLRASDNVAEPQRELGALGAGDVLVDGNGGRGQASGDLDVAKTKSKDVALVEGIETNAGGEGEPPPRINDGLEGGSADFSASGLQISVALEKRKEKRRGHVRAH